jgi:hypothetical protein
LGPHPLPSKISTVIALETTSLDAKSFADGAYLSMNLSPYLLNNKLIITKELVKKPPSPLHPSVIKHPDP